MWGTEFKSHKGIFLTIDVIIKGGTVVSHQGVERKDIAIRDGIIVAMGNLSEVNAKTYIDADGLHILPGVIDTDFHLGELQENEFRAAIRGGVSSAFTFGTPLAPSPLDYAPYLKVTSENDVEVLSQENAEGVAGVFVSMSDPHSFTGDKGLRGLLKNANRRVVVHAEDFKELEKRKGEIEIGNVTSHTAWHDEQVSIEAIRRILAIARGAGQPIHLMHVSGAKELGMIAAYKEIATVSLSPHHLFLSGPECYQHFREYAQIDPPIREEENRIGLWKALSSGIVDMVGSYHMPIPTDEKEHLYPDSKAGAPSIQTMLPLLLDQVNNGSLSLNLVMDLTSAGPARCFNIARKGRIAVGYDADFALCNLTEKWVFNDDDVESSCGWDHHAGVEIVGKVTGTMIRGELAMWESKLTGKTSGQPIKFTDTFIEYEDE